MFNPVVRKYLHDLAYVNFKSKSQIKDTEVIHKKEFYAIVESLSKTASQIDHTTVKERFKSNTFALTEKRNYLRLTWRDKDGYHQRYTNYKDDKKNDKKGKSTFTEFSKLFMKNNKIDLLSAFGSVPQYFKKCVIGLFHYDNPEYSMCLKTGKLDFSSHFPACAKGKLPTTKDMQILNGRIAPTKDYPFAFYIRSGFVAEYGEYDSRDWHDTIYRKSLFESEERNYKIENVKDEEETTVLMKASEYSLDKEMDYYYSAKLKCKKGTEEYNDAKLILLKLVGQMEMNDCNNYNNRPYAHLAAIIKARAVNKMLKLIDKVGASRVISVIVDGLIFDNSKKVHLGDSDEHIGSLKEENFAGFGRFKGHNQYIIIENGKTDIVHAGYDINTDIPDFSKWGKSPALAIRDNIRNLGLYIEDLNNEEERKENQNN